MGTVADMSIVAEPAVVSVERPPADRFMRALLRVDRVENATAADARKALQTSVMVSAVRCLLTYIVLPFVLLILWQNMVIPQQFYRLELRRVVGAVVGQPVAREAVKCRDGDRLARRARGRDADAAVLLLL